MAAGYILQCYAPTNEATQETKDDFHDQLQMVLEQVPCRDVKIVMGDMNAKVGMNNTGRGEVMGKHGAGAEMNKNDERWARNKKREASIRYQEFNREEKRRCRKDRRVYVNSEAERAERLERGDVRSLYKITRMFQNTCKPVRNEAGMLHRRAEEEMHQWREHSQTVLDHEEPLNPPEVE